jgi:hypothetical protein
MRGSAGKWGGGGGEVEKGVQQPLHPKLTTETVFKEKRGLWDPMPELNKTSS